MGRSGLLAAVMIALSAGSAAAQVATGPLADPHAVTNTKPAGASGAKVARKLGHGGKHRHAKAASLPAAAQPAGDAATGSRPQPTSSANRRVNADASDPISFGMKWNGSNDNAEKTRVQNYDGEAQGTGAEVGLKLHF